MGKLLGLRNVMIARNKFCKYPNNVLVILHFFAICVLDKMRVSVRRINYSILNKQTNP